MSSPVTADDLVTGATEYLAVYADVRAVLGKEPGTNNLYLYRHRPWVKIENSQSTICVLTRTTGWAPPNLHNTMRFPRLGVDIWVDPLRDTDNNVVDPDEAVRRAFNAYTVIDRHLHRPQGGERWFGTIRTIACERIVEPILLPTNPDTPLRLQVFYAVTEG
jgi:hypothetical protein